MGRRASINGTRNAYGAVPELPTGTVTFLFTDVEGSTRLLDDLGDRYAAVLAQHRLVSKDAIERHGGVVVDVQGDALFAAFQRATDAVAAAEEAQVALEVPVRMGIHTGEPGLTDEGYIGIDVHRAARICSAAHGGQVVVSETTQKLVEAPLRSLGEHRLKDLGQPITLFQLGEGEFPRLRSLNQTNFPVQPTPLVGRDRELAALLSLVRDSRLVTLTGPGGSGKTRLALQVGAELEDQLSDGVFFVALAPITDPALVISTIAKTLGLREAEGEAIDETLQRYLADKELLLLLDNFEQLPEATPAVAAVLAAAPGLKALVTSRAPLRLSGEREYAVPPLSTEDAVALFTDRAQSVHAEFRLTDENETAVTDICIRLDGLPLAIELAAVRVKLLAPQALLTRLEQRLPILTGGPRDAPARQQTLRAAIDWSYALLDKHDRTVFCQLGVFAGGCAVNTAEEVCGATLDDLASLVDKNLLRRAEGAGGDPRVSMLQTIREYALEQLNAREEADELRRRHAEHYLGLAETSEPEILRADQALWLERLQYELDNFRAALRWSLDQDEVELALRLIGSLRRAWVARGYLGETRSWLETALSRGKEVESRVRAKALYGLGRVALVQADYEYAVPRLEQSTELFRKLDDAEGLVYSLADIGWIETARGSLDRARQLADESVAIARRSGDETLIAAAVHSLACTTLEHGQHARAKELFEESLALRRSLGDKRNVASSLGYLGLVALLEGDYDNATTSLERSLALGRELENRLIVSSALANLALASLLRGEPKPAASLARESLDLSRELGDKRTIVECLHVLADVAATAEQFSRAATLTGAAEALHDAISAPPSVAERLTGEQPAGQEAEEPWQRGRAMDLEQAVAFGLATTDVN
jgi:predicted ATPase/class 3 adenylate cyclase